MAITCRTFLVQSGEVTFCGQKKVYSVYHIFHGFAPRCTFNKTGCFLTHPERVRRDKIKVVQLLCMGYNVTKSNFKTTQVLLIHGTYWYILVHTGTYRYRRKPNSTLHLITLCPPSCAYESQQNAWLGPFAQFSSSNVLVIYTSTYQYTLVHTNKY
jgi:hypothetical protein